MTALWVVCFTHHDDNTEKLFDAAILATWYCFIQDKDINGFPYLNDIIPATSGNS